MINMKLVPGIFLILFCSACGAPTGDTGGGSGGGSGSGSGSGDGSGTGGGDVTQPIDDSATNPGNAPTAHAGTDAAYNGGENAMLDGTASSDPDEDMLLYRWRQTGGANTVTLDSPFSSRPVFEVPNANDVLTFELVVSDGYDDSIADSVSITTHTYSGSSATLPTSNPFRTLYSISNLQGNLYFSGNTLYVSTVSGGISVLDATSPLALSLQSSSNMVNSFDHTVVGSYAYHLSYDSTWDELYISTTDVSNPASISYYTGVATISSTTSGKITSAGDVLYVASDNSLDIYQITNTADPTSTTFKVSHSIPTAAKAISVVGNYAYLANGTAGLRIVDVSNATAVTPSTSDSGNYDTSGNAVGLYIDGNYAYIADDTGGVVILDITTPGTPSLVKSFAVPSGASVRAVNASGNTLYVASESDFWIYDTSTKSSPTLIANYRADNWITGISLNNSYAYLATYSGISILPISNPALPTGAPVYTAGEAIQDIKFYGDYGIVKTDHTLNILDMRNVSTPVLKSSYSDASHSWISDLALVGNYLYFTNNSQVSLLRLRDPVNPTVVRDIDMVDWTDDIVTSDGYAYVYTNGYDTSTVKIFDTSNSVTPVLRGTLNAPSSNNWLRSIAYYNDKLFLTEFNTFGTFWVADVSNKDAPALLGSGMGPVDMYSMTMQKGYIYTIDNNTGVRAVDVSTPDNPVIVGNTYPQQGYNLFSSGNLIFSDSDYVAGPTTILNAIDPLNPTLAGQVYPAGGANTGRLNADKLYFVQNDNQIYVQDSQPALNTRYISEMAGQQVSYTVSWSDFAGSDDQEVKCYVSGGSCLVTGTDHVTNTATVSWDLPITAGDHEISFLLGNSNYYITTNDRITVQ